jgi:hypothetical protein
MPSSISISGGRGACALGEPVQRVASPVPDHSRRELGEWRPLTFGAPDLKSYHAHAEPRRDLFRREQIIGIACTRSNEISRALVEMMF